MDHAALGNFGAPLTGVVLADYLVVKTAAPRRGGALDAHGRYRYLNGVNVAAVLAVTVGIGLYYAVPDTWLKVVVGVTVGAATYLALVVAAETERCPPPVRDATGTVASSQRSSSPS